MSSYLSYAQNKNVSAKLKPDRIGIYYGFGNEDNFIFNDKDYFYKINIIKASFYYSLNQRKYQLGLSVQPQIHFLEHQLLNKYFVQPDKDNFEELRERYTQLKSMQLYGLQFELLLKRKFFKKLEFFIFLGIGPAYINTKTERLAKDFTFIENFGVGINYQIHKSFFLELKPSFSHVSNLNIQIPNSGYNSINIEVGLGFYL